MTLIVTVVLIALVFEYINGFHDTANAIATVVSTKVLTPRQAVILAAVCNLLGAMAGVSVATTIGRGLVDTSYVTVLPSSAPFSARSCGTCLRGGSACPRVPATRWSAGSAARRWPRRTATGA